MFQWTQDHQVPGKMVQSFKTHMEVELAEMQFPL